MLLDYLSRLFEILLNQINARFFPTFLQSALKHTAVNSNKAPASSDQLTSFSDGATLSIVVLIEIIVLSTRQSN